MFRMSRTQMMKNSKTGAEVIQLIRIGEGMATAGVVGEISNMEYDAETIANKIVELWNNQ